MHDITYMSKIYCLEKSLKFKKHRLCAQYIIVLHCTSFVLKIHKKFIFEINVRTLCDDYVIIIAIALECFVKLNYNLSLKAI